MSIVSLFTFLGAENSKLMASELCKRFNRKDLYTTADCSINLQITVCGPFNKIKRKGHLFVIHSCSIFVITNGMLSKLLNCFP